MIDLVEAKLLGLWAPREGQKTDAMFMTRAERDYRRQEAWLMWLAWDDPERYELMRPVAEV